MKSIHSIILIKRGEKYLNYFDDRWKCYLFPNIKGNDIGKIKEKYNTDKVELLFDKIHEKYSISHGENREYHHYFYKVDAEIKGEYFSLDELLIKSKDNKDIIEMIKREEKNG